MKRGFLLILVSFCCSYAVMAQNKLWSDVQRESVPSYIESHKNTLPKKFRFVKLNRVQASDLQRQAPMENVRSKQKISPVQFEIPLPDGQRFQYAIAESPIISGELQAQLASVKTYELTDKNNKTSSGRLTITPDGVTGLLFTKKGTVYISPIGKDYPDVHMVYYVKDVKPTNPTICGVKETLETVNNNREMGTLAGDCQLRTYRLAVSATGEYTAWAGSQANALAYITTTVNNLNAIYERDATIRFTLVTTTNIIYANAASDPYPTIGFPNGAYLNTNTSFTNANLVGGAGAYDVGIVFNDGWDGGLAQLSSVCTANKGNAAAGLTFGEGANPAPGPQGPIFDGTVAHEIAHQFSATHSFAATNGASCAGSVTAATAFEPGGGSTIMSYGNVCFPNYYQEVSDLYFHGGNILQIQNFATGAGDVCPAHTSTGNNPPAVSTFAPSFTIPISTPFILSANGNDPDGNTLTYTFDQVNTGFTTSLPPQTTNVNGPNFRSYPPSTDNFRVFPSMADIVAGISPAYEVLPSVGRTMNFQVMVRDNAAGGGCTDEDNMSVITNAGAGPFVVTSQSTPATWTANGTNTQTITWNVANTNAAPINCTDVSILLSIDGGLTYPYTLAATTANDGSEVITVPNLPTSVGRIMVRSVNNIFFNINSAFITIASSCAAEGATVDPETLISEPAGAAALDLVLSPLYGTPVTISGTLQNTDPTTNLLVNNLSAGVCGILGNTWQYDTYRFTVNVAGNYTFQRSGGTSFLCVFDLFSGEFNPSNPCSNFINSIGTFNGSTVNIGANFTASLTPGIYYTMVVGTFNTGSPALPANYTINVTAAPPGGGLYDAAPDPGAGFSYAFVVVENASGDIVAIDPAPGPNLSNGTAFPAGDYTIYGLSYSNSVSLATLNGYIGQLFTTLQNDILFNPATLCSNLSKNSVTVNILQSLPVTMLPLKATPAGNKVVLNWGTAFEQNSSHFEVWRSTDGVNFNHLVGTVQAQGNSNNIVNYSLTDNAPEKGMNYYRVRELDKDERQTLSNIASVNMTQTAKGVIVYPNPATTTLTLEYYTEKIEDIQVKVIDSKGAVVRQLQFNMQAGRNVKSVNVGALAKGVYALQTTGSAGTMVTRFVKE